MKKYTLFLFLLISFLSFSQQVTPILTFNGFFQNFQEGYFRQVELQRIKEYKAGDDICAYVDFRGNLIAYDGLSKKQLANLSVEYRVSDKLLTWKIGETLNMWDKGKIQTLSFNVRNYWVKDEIIVFEDMRFNSVSVYFNGRIYPLYTSMGELQPPSSVGENIVAYKDNGDYNKVFWNGQIYELDVWQTAYDFQTGTDILAFNDPITGTFAVFENGEFLDVEEFHVNKYRAGRGFIVYEDRNNNLVLYQNGEVQQLTNFGASFWEVKDDVVYWQENGFTYIYADGQKKELARYIPKDYALKNGVVAFRNIMGGVSAYVDGKVHEITNQMNSSFEIYGNTVLVELFNNSYIVLWKGKNYRI